jgi:hypothetical protein
MPWTYACPINKNQKNEDDSYYFEGMIFNDFEIINRVVLEACGPLLNFLSENKDGDISLRRLKANFYQGGETFIEHTPHIDFERPYKAFVYFLNTNNGYTKVLGSKAPSVENSGVSFLSNESHSSTNCTNFSKRLTLNVNYW